MRGWEHVTPADLLKRDLAKKPSKYRNAKHVVDGIQFDSKREAEVYRGLQLRQTAGEIRHLKRQVAFPLYAPARAIGLDTQVEVAAYVADFTYEALEPREGHPWWRFVVADAKGMRTQLYRLKKKWLFLQDGIEILEL